MTSWVRRTPARLFWLIARHFLSDMVEPPPDCRYCRRWPSSGSLDCCTLCRCCFQLSRFSHDPSLTPERYDNLVSRLTGVLGELTVHSSFPLHLGRSESPRRNRGHHTHRRAPSPSRSPSSPSPRHSPRAAGGRDRRSRSSGRRSEREHQHEREAWAPTLRHQRNPERGEHQGFASRSPASGGNRIPSPPPPPRKTRIELKPPPTPPPRRSEIGLPSLIRGKLPLRSLLLRLLQTGLVGLLLGQRQQSRPEEKERAKLNPRKGLQLVRKSQRKRKRTEVSSAWLTGLNVLPKRDVGKVRPKQLQALRLLKGRFLLRILQL